MQKIRSPRLDARFVVICLVLAAVAFLAGRWLYPTLRTPATAQQPDFSPMAVPTEADHDQLVLVYIGSSRCGACRSPDLPTYMSAIRESIGSIALAKSLGYVTIGVASELSPVQGLLHLEQIGTFDEVAAGQGKLNQANMHFVSRDHPGLQATPQVVVLLRSLQAAPTGLVDHGSITERVLVRKIGLRELQLWKEQGTPLPRFQN